jgi:wobble nucleotide-excising tRNase
MIKKITKLKRFGIFQNYTWGSISEFKHKDLIYGWNYSGKTTLSKLFQILEVKDKNKYFSGSEFDITIDDNGTEKQINQDSLATFPFFVKVFNSEYTKRIFTWDEPKTGFNPIAFYLGDPAGDLKTKIKKLEKINERLINLRDNKYKGIVEAFEIYDKQGGKFTDKAKDIRDNYLQGIFDQNKLNKSHIKDIANVVKGDLVKHILSSTDRDATKAEATALKKFDKQEENLSIKGNLQTLTASVKSILEDTAPKAISFPELDADPILFDWIQKGIPLHQDATECKFCTKALPESRIQDLNSYYSKKLQEIQTAISKVNQEISAEKELFKIIFPNKKEISDTYQEVFIKAVESFEETKKEYENQLDILESDLKNKATSIFVAIPSSPIAAISFEKEFDAIEAIIKNHNVWLEKFDERKNAAINKILNHYVAEYLTAENYNQKEADKNSANQTIGLINSKLNANKLLIDNYNAQLNDKVKGQAELNTILEILLNREDIKIEIKNDKFTLERSGHPANDLSEGEKSAIAFSYFLTELKALRDDDPPKIPKTIIFIDDPISSLDSNHIFQVRSLLKDFFKKDDFAQLFISTHNFEFFSMLMDSEELFHRQKPTKADFYFIKRLDSNETSIIHLPNSFKQYNSEYVSLFHILNDFNKLADKSTFTYTILLPNAMRRFLELYTAMKYPSSRAVDVRVKEVFSSTDGTYHRVKLLHWFSHQNQFEKVQKHDDKLLQIEEAIKDLMEHIENKDELHWRGLNGI